MKSSLMWVKRESTSTSKMDNKPLLFLSEVCVGSSHDSCNPTDTGGKEFIRKTEYLACLTCRPRGVWGFRATVRSLRMNKPLPLFVCECAFFNFFCMHLCFLGRVLQRISRRAFCVCLVKVYSLLTDFLTSR